MDLIARLLGLQTHDTQKAISQLLKAGVAEKCPMSGALMCPEMVRRDEQRRKWRDAKNGGGGGAGPPGNGCHTTVEFSKNSNLGDIRGNCTSELPLGDKEGSGEKKGKSRRSVEEVYAEISEIPIPLVHRNNAAFVAKWAMWVQFRLTSKGIPKLPKLVFAEQLSRLEKYTTDQAIDLLSQAISGNWQAPVWDKQGKPITAANGPPKRQSVFELKTILQAKEDQAKGLKDRYSSEGPLTTDWESEEKRQEWVKLRKEIKELKAQIANYPT